MFTIPSHYLDQPDPCPPFWISACEAVDRFLNKTIRVGTIETIGASAGGRPIRAVAYGQPRQGKGTTTFSGSLGFKNAATYLGPEAGKKVYLAIAGVHGGEFEGIAGCVNLLSIMETGCDVTGAAWPDIEEAFSRLDRVVVIPIANPDGRARVPIRFLSYRGEDHSVFQYFNTGAWIGGKQIGWPTCKEFIPLNFAHVEFPGGYPNDNGVNIQHDDFFGHPQPETRALFDLTARERPDLILSMHTGAPLNNYYTRMYRPFIEPAFMPAWETLYHRTHTALTHAGLQETRDPAIEADPAQQRMSVFNLDSALNLHCGALSALVESPCPGYAARNRKGQLVHHQPEDILKAQLFCHREAALHLSETGGRIHWMS